MEGNETQSQDKNLALIIPQFCFDAQSSQLIKSTPSVEYENIANRVYYQDGKYLVTGEDSKDITPFNPIDSSSEIENNVHVLGNVKDFANLSTSMYQNRSISYVLSFISEVLVLLLDCSFRGEFHFCRR